jgi:hypothetical protein
MRATEKTEIAFSRKGKGERKNRNNRMDAGEMVSVGKD